MFYDFAKRVLDIVASLIAIVVFLPIMIVVAIAIKLESPTGPIFADMPNRVGKDRKLFKMFKFRSMIPNAHKLLEDPRYRDLAEKYAKNNHKLKVDEDPRILKIGKFIRKTDIDEFPQFFNVLLGQMSIVGPRACFEPELVSYAKEFPEAKENIEKMLKTKPGITGPWQVSGRNSITIPMRMKMDAEYAARRNIFYDIFIIIKTPIAVFTRLGAYE